MRGQQTEADRIAELERDPQCSQFDAHRCLCAACGRWVHLSGRAHKIFNWRRHKKGCTLQKARGAITIIQSKSPQQRPHGNDSAFSFRTRDVKDELEDVGMDVDDEMDIEKRSAYTHSDDSYYDASPSPNTTHSNQSSSSNKSGVYDPNPRSADKRYLQLPSITTFALSPTGSISTPPLTSSDAASCSTSTSESGHSLISSWSQVQPTYAHPQGATQTGSWGRTSHRPRGASTSSFRSLPPLSSTSSTTATSVAGSPPTSSKHHFRSRGGPPATIECEGCQTILDPADWSSHKRSCRAYVRHQLDSNSNLSASSYGITRGGVGLHYSHSHSRSQPIPVLPPLITTAIRNYESSHANPLRHSKTSPPSIPTNTRADRSSLFNASYGGSSSFSAGGNVSTTISATTKLSTSHSETTLSPHHHSPPRLSIDTSFSRSSALHGHHCHETLISAALGGSPSTTLTAHLDHSHISRHANLRSHHHSHQLQIPNSSIYHTHSSEPYHSSQSNLFADSLAISSGGTRDHSSIRSNANADASSSGGLCTSDDCANSSSFRTLSRSSSHVDLTHSPTSSKSGTGSNNSGRASLKIADLCHPSSDSENGPSSLSNIYSLNTNDYHRSRSVSPQPHRARSWSSSRSVSRSRHVHSNSHHYPTRPTQRHQSSEDNSITPTHTPHIHTSISTTISSNSNLSRSRMSILRSYTASPSIESEGEGSSSSSNIRAVQYSYSQSRSTFQYEFDSEDEDEKERIKKISRVHGDSPLRSLSPPSPYVSDS